MSGPKLLSSLRDLSRTATLTRRATRRGSIRPVVPPKTIILRIGVRSSVARWEGASHGDLLSLFVHIFQLPLDLAVHASDLRLRHPEFGHFYSNFDIRDVVDGAVVDFYLRSHTQRDKIEAAVFSRKVNMIDRRRERQRALDHELESSRPYRSKSSPMPRTNHPPPPTTTTTAPPLPLPLPPTGDGPEAISTSSSDPSPIPRRSATVPAPQHETMDPSQALEAPTRPTRDSNPNPHRDTRYGSPPPTLTTDGNNNGNNPDPETSVQTTNDPDTGQEDTQEDTKDIKETGISDWRPGSRMGTRGTETGYGGGAEGDPGISGVPVDRAPWRVGLWTFLDEPFSSRGALMFMVSIILIVVASTVTFIVESMPRFSLDTDQKPLTSVWFVAESCFIAIFTLEICARLVSCPSIRDYFFSKSSFANWIDVVSVLPYYIELVVLLATNSGGNLPSLQVLRVVRLVRVFRMYRLSRNSLAVFGTTLRKSIHPIVMLAMLASVCLILFGTVVYYLEGGVFDTDRSVQILRHEYQCLVNVATTTRDGLDDEFTNAYPDCIYVATLSPTVATVDCPFTYQDDAELRFGAWDCLPIEVMASDFNSIPQSFWFVMVTIMTVGYGDTFPIYDGGKVVTALMMLVAIMVLVLPISVIGSTFSTEYRALVEREEKREHRRLRGRKRALRHQQRRGEGGKKTSSPRTTPGETPNAVSALPSATPSQEDIVLLWGEDVPGSEGGG